MIYWNEIGVHDNFIFGWWDMIFGMVGM